MKEFSANYERYKSFYEKGWYNEEMLQNLVNKGRLTQEEFESIVGTN